MAKNNGRKEPLPQAEASQPDEAESIGPAPAEPEPTASRPAPIEYGPSIQCPYCGHFYKLPCDAEAKDSCMNYQFKLSQNNADAPKRH